MRGGCIMKKKMFLPLGIIVSVIACLVLAVPVGKTAQAMELNNDECDTVFWENVSELYEGDKGALTVTATKELLFDMDLEKLGFAYDFYANGERGYAIVIGVDGSFEATEFFFDSVDPYAEVKEGEKRIYVDQMTYLISDGEKYYTTERIPIDKETIKEIRKEAFYSDNSVLGDYSEYVYYTNRSETKHELAKRHPGLTEIADLSNACAAIAGGNLVQYWDRYKTNLIPNYTPGIGSGNLYMYNESNAKTTAVITQLYSDMGMGSTGATVSMFKNGIETYCVRQGYSATFTSCMSSGAFDYSQAKQQLVAGKPLALFVSMFTFCGITQGSGYDYLDYKVGIGTHVMAGFGYKEVTYAVSGGTRKDYYIAVASGYNAKKRGFFNVNFNAQIDDAYSLLVS